MIYCVIVWIQRTNTLYTIYIIYTQVIINFLELPHFYKSELLKKKKTISNHKKKKKKNRG